MNEDYYIASLTVEQPLGGETNLTTSVEYHVPIYYYTDGPPAVAESFLPFDQFTLLRDLENLKEAILKTNDSDLVDRFNSVIRPIVAIATDESSRSIKV